MLQGGSFMNSTASKKSSGILFLTTVLLLLTIFQVTSFALKVSVNDEKFWEGLDTNQFSAFSTGGIIKAPIVDWPESAYSVGVTNPAGLKLKVGDTVSFSSNMPTMKCCSNGLVTVPTYVKIDKHASYKGSSKINWKSIAVDYVAKIFTFTGRVESVDPMEPDYITNIVYDFFNYDSGGYMSLSPAGSLMSFALEPVVVDPVAPGTPTTTVAPTPAIVQNDNVVAVKVTVPQRVIFKGQSMSASATVSSSTVHDSRVSSWTMLNNSIATGTPMNDSTCNIQGLSVGRTTLISKLNDQFDSMGTLITSRGMSVVEVVDVGISAVSTYYDAIATMPIKKINLLV